MVSFILDSWPFIAVVAALAAIGVMLSRLRSQADAPRYAPRELLLDRREQAWFQKLRRAVAGRQYVLAKVRLGDLVSLGSPEKHDDEELHRIDTTHVDFVICQPRSLQPRLAIRLMEPAPDSSDLVEDDEDSHSDRRKENEFVGDILDAAGIPRMELDVNAQTGVPRLRQLIRQRLA
jgi:hypothetical protein